MSDLFYLKPEQLNYLIKPYFPLFHGVPRVDDLRVISGITTDAHIHSSQLSVFVLPLFRHMVDLMSPEPSQEAIKHPNSSVAL